MIASTATRYRGTLTRAPPANWINSKKTSSADRLRPGVSGSGCGRPRQSVLPSPGAENWAAAVQPSLPSGTRLSAKVPHPWTNRPC